MVNLRLIERNGYQYFKFQLVLHSLQLSDDIHKRSCLTKAKYDNEYFDYTKTIFTCGKSVL